MECLDGLTFHQNEYEERAGGIASDMDMMKQTLSDLGEQLTV